MDYETPRSPLVEVDRPIANKASETRLVFTREEEDRASGNLDGKPRSFADLGSKSNRRRLPLLACIAASAGLIAYGASSRWGSHPSGRSTFKFALPPAQSAAAIKALPAPNLLKPLSPNQASKQNAERPFADRPDSPANRFLLKTDAEDTDRAVTCLAQAVYYETAGEGVNGQRAVAQVVLNRVHHPGFPSTICGVVYEGSDRSAGCQFSFTCDGSMEHVPIPWLWARSKEIAEQALKGRVFAPVGHATHYHADYVVPYWADSLDKSVQIGKHIFYRLRNSLGDARAFSQHYGGSEPSFREPGTTLLLPLTAESERLSNALIAGSSEIAAANEQKASQNPNSPLLVDLQHRTLIADGGLESARSKPAKGPDQCSNPSEHKQTSALKADDDGASIEDFTCRGEAAAAGVAR